ncbi:MAG: hypothetical protein ACE15C_07610 [Phycisphaerae bacterium]
MKLLAVALSGLAMALLACSILAQATRPAIDWDKARTLYQRSQRGEKLTDEERAYVRMAQAEINAGRGPGRSGPGTRPGPGARPGAPTTQLAKTGLVPLDQMSATDRYKGEDGGLYGKGENAPPKEHLAAALKALAKVQPLDKDGKPAADGKIVLMSVGMSNTANEFAVFKAVADKDADKDPRVVVVNGAQGGMTAMSWSKADSKVWQVAEQHLQQAGVTPRQVQVIWLKQAEAGPAQYGDFPKHAQFLKDNVVKDVQQVRQHYPNVQVVYLSSRIYAGYAKTGLNPEPYAYEGAFAMRWAILDQIAGKPELNFDPAKGEVKAPVLLWGPYLWADGIAGRKSDSLVWNIDDLSAGDGTHPSSSGSMKVAKLLLDFFKKDPAAGTWFVKPKDK